MQLLVYVWTQVKGQTLHWVKANFLAGGKLHPCDETQMRVDFAIYTLFHVTYFFVWLEVYHLCRVSEHYHMGIKVIVTIWESVGLIIYWISKAAQSGNQELILRFSFHIITKIIEVIKNIVFLFYSYITPTSQFPLRLSRGCNSNKSDHCLLISLPFNDWCRK